MIERLKYALVFMLLCGALQAAEAPKPVAAPKTVGFSPQHKAAIAAMNVRLETLAQEARAVEAEKQNIQLQFKALLDDACRAAGGTDCQPDLEKGTFTVPSKPSEEVKK